MPRREEPNHECKVVKTAVKGDTVIWVMGCKTPEGTAVSNGRVTYKSDTFDGVVKMNMPGKRSAMEMTQNLRGK